MQVSDIFHYLLFLQLKVEVSFVSDGVEIDAVEFSGGLLSEPEEVLERRDFFDLVLVVIVDKLEF